MAKRDPLEDLSQENVLPNPGVYVITNSVNNKRYYGSSVNCLIRRRSHFGHLRRGDHNNSHLQRAWNKHGESAFSFSVVEYVPEEKLKSTEQIYIDQNVGGYNIEPHAEKSGGRRSEETRSKIAKTLTGYKRSAEEVEKSRASRSGGTRTEITKMRVSRGLRRHFSKHGTRPSPKSEETKRRVSEGLRRYYANNPEAAAASAARIRSHLTSEVIQRRSESIRKRWQGPEGNAKREQYRQRMQGSSKITAETVLQIVTLLSTQSVAEVADAFGLNISTIYYIRSGKNWSHVTGIVLQKKRRN